MALNPLKYLQPRQLEIAKSIIKADPLVEKYHIIRASRQSGKSFLLRILLITFAFRDKGQEIAVVMANAKQTKTMFRNLKKIIPTELIRASAASDSDRYIELTNGTIINFFTAGNADSIAGNSFDYLFCDEVGLWKPDAWEIIKPSIAAKRYSKVIAVSTPRGSNGTFYEMCMAGMNPEDERYQHYRMSWRDNKLYDPKEVEDSRRKMHPDFFRQEYEAEFIDGLDNVFKNLKSYTTLRSWSKPDKRSRYFYGIDWAGEGTDRIVITILRQDGKIAYIESIDKTLGIDYRWRRCIEIIKDYRAIGYSESNGVGTYPTQKLKETSGVNVKAYTQTNQTKVDNVAELIADLQTGVIELPTEELCEELITEMDEYMSIQTPSGKLSYNHPAGGHDDFLDSLMMANAARKSMTGGANISVPSPSVKVKDKYTYKVFGRGNGRTFG